MGSLQFSIGEGFGELLTSVAREKLTEQCDLDGGVALLIQSLPGMNEDQALSIIFGDMVLTEDVEEQTVSLRPASEESSGFDVVAWLVSRNSTFMKDAESWLEVTANMGPLNGVRKEVEVKYADLIKYYWDGSAKELFEHDADLNGLRYLVTGVRGFLDKYTEFLTLYNRIVSKIPDKFSGGKKIEVCEEVVDLNKGIGVLMMSQHDRDTSDAYLSYYDERLKRYLETERILSDESFDVKPVDITEGYDAGWLAPNGDYYGLRGEVSNMLHARISEALQSKGIIPTPLPDDCTSPDRWLETNGWVKIHNDWILFDGYDLFGVRGKEVPLTEKQRESIYRYGQVCWRGMLTFGFSRKQISAARFEMTEPLMLKKLFE